MIAIPPESGSLAVSVIIPTIGRPDSLRRLLQSLTMQSYRVREVIVADGSATLETKILVGDHRWKEDQLLVRRIEVRPPNAVRQRIAAIGQASGELLLLLDDDVVLQPDCLAKMVHVFDRDPGAVGVFAHFSNMSWPMPTRAWRLYLRYALGIKEGQWQGRVVGPLLRFGFNPLPDADAEIEWIGAGNSLIRRSAYDLVGGFSDFFLHRCTMNEDVDLGLKLAKVGRIVFCPRALMAHHHSPSGRVSPSTAAEDDLYNRYLIMRRTQAIARTRALRLIILYFFVETASSLARSGTRIRLRHALSQFLGRARAIVRIFSGRSRVTFSRGEGGNMVAGDHRGSI